MRELRAEDRSYRLYLRMWSGRLASTLGSALTSFALSVWIYQQTGSATSFGMSMFCSILPGLLVSPLAGSFADRFPRKVLIVVPDIVDGLIKLALALAFLAGDMQLWMVYAIILGTSVTGTFQAVALQASIPDLVPREDFVRANGLAQFSATAQSLLAPILGGLLYATIGLGRIVLLDVATFALALLTVAITPFPRAVPAEAHEHSGARRVWADLTYGFGCLRSAPGLFTTLVVFAALNFIANLAIALLGPMVLARFSAQVYGFVEAMFGGGMLLGAVLATSVPAVAARARRMLVVLLLSGVGLLAVGVSTSWIAIGLGMAVLMLPVPYANSLFSATLQTVVPGNALGRTGAAVGMVLKSVTPVAVLVAGPLAENVFTPLVAPDGALAGSLPEKAGVIVIGNGEALMFLCAGLALVVTLLLALRARSVRRLDELQAGLLAGDPASAADTPQAGLAENRA